MQLMKQSVLVAICGLFATVAASADPTVVLTENFTYADGSLAAGNPAWVNHSGTAGTLLVAGGQAVVTQNSGSEDLHRVFDGAASFSSGLVAANFEISVTAPGAMNSTTLQYFAHFWQSSATTSFRTRTFIVPPGTAGGDYSIGISTLTAAAPEFSLGDLVGFSFGVVVPMTITFDIDAGTGSLTAGGQTINSLVVSTGQNIDGFALRQANSSSDETILVDNLVVTHTPVPEPSTYALLFGLLALGAVVRGRRR